MRAAVIEAEIREEVMREMEERIQEIEKRFSRRLMNEVCLAGKTYARTISHHRINRSS